MGQEQPVPWGVLFAYIRRAMIVVFMIVLIGTISLMLTEGWSLGKTLYMIVITVTTVGFGDVTPETPVGKIITVFLAFFGIGTFLYVVSHLAEIIVGDTLTASLRKRHMNQEIQQLQDHVIVCGLGRVGEQVAKQLSELEQTFVVIEKDPNRIEICRSHHWLHVAGDATVDSDMERAGIHQAKALISAVKSDADNVFITLTARALCDSIHIISRMEHPQTEEKLKRAGANEVISPHAVGGKEMVRAMLT